MEFEIDNSAAFTKKIGSCLWTGEQCRSLRLRLGWSQSEMARRWACAVSEIENFENGTKTLDHQHHSELELLSLQAEFCSEELQAIPRLEVRMQEGALEQLDLNDVRFDVHN